MCWKWARVIWGFGLWTVELRGERKGEERENGERGINYWLTSLVVDRRVRLRMCQLGQGAPWRILGRPTGLPCANSRLCPWRRIGAYSSVRAKAWAWDMSPLSYDIRLPTTYFCEPILFCRKFYFTPSVH